MRQSFVSLLLVLGVTLTSSAFTASQTAQAWTEPMNTSCRADYETNGFNLVSAYNANTTGFHIDETKSFVIFQNIGTGDWRVVAQESAQIYRATIEGGHGYYMFGNYAHVMNFGVTGTYTSQTDDDSAQAVSLSANFCVVVENNVNDSHGTYPYTGSETIPQYSGTVEPEPEPTDYTLYRDISAIETGDCTQIFDDQTVKVWDGNELRVYKLITNKYQLSESHDITPGIPGEVECVTQEELESLVSKFDFMIPILHTIAIASFLLIVYAGYRLLIYPWFRSNT